MTTYPPIEGDSTDAAVAGVTGTNSANQQTVLEIVPANQPGGGPGPGPGPHPVGPVPAGVLGQATGAYGTGVVGTSTRGNGVQGSALGIGAGVTGSSVSGSGVAGSSLGDGAGVTGSSINGQGVFGQGGSVGVYGWGGSAGTGIGVQGVSSADDAVVGSADSGIGVHGTSVSGDAVVGWTEVGGNGGNFTANGTGSGVLGTSALGTGGTFVAQGAGDGVHGTTADANHSGVWGNNTGSGNGVSGSTADANHSGVWGNNTGGGNGVSGSSTSGNGVSGSSTRGNGVYAYSGSGTGLYAASGKGGSAGYFEGDCTTAGNHDINGILTVGKPTVVPAPGPGATTAFVYTVQPEDLYPQPSTDPDVSDNFYQSCFVLNHASVDNNPNAVIFITQVLTQVEYNPNITGVSTLAMNQPPSSWGVIYGTEAKPVQATGFRVSSTNEIIFIPPVKNQWVVVGNFIYDYGAPSSEFPSSEFPSPPFPPPPVPSPSPSSPSSSWPVGQQFHVWVMYT